MDDFIFIPKPTSTLVGIAFVEKKENRVIIHYLSSKEELRERGIGSQLIQFIASHFSKRIEAETDDDAVSFYKKIGFKVESFCDEKYKIIRYKCLYDPKKS